MATNFQATTSLAALIAMSMCIALLSQTTVAFNDIFPRGDNGVRRLLDPVPQLMPFPYPPREGWGGFRPFPFPPIGGGGGLPFPFPPIGGGDGLPFPFPSIGGGGGRRLPFPFPPISGGGKSLPLPIHQYCSNPFFAFLFPFQCHKPADSPSIAPTSDSSGNAASPLPDSPTKSPAYGYEEVTSELKTPSTNIWKCLPGIIRVGGCVEDIQKAIFGGQTIGKDCCKAIDATRKRHALSNDCLSKGFAGFDPSVPQYLKSVCAAS